MSNDDNRIPNVFESKSGWEANLNETMGLQSETTVEEEKEVVETLEEMGFEDFLTAFSNERVKVMFKVNDHEGSERRVVFYVKGLTEAQFMIWKGKTSELERTRHVLLTGVIEPPLDIIKMNAMPPGMSAYLYREVLRLSFLHHGQAYS